MSYAAAHTEEPESAMCECSRIGKGVQLFRIRNPERLFREIADLGPQGEQMIGGRRVWECRSCKRPFALLRLPFKDEEDILVAPANSAWQVWDWPALADVAGSCRWRGPAVDARWVL